MNNDQLNEIRSRINPQYSWQHGTESFERKLLTDEILSNRAEIAGLVGMLNDFVGNDASPERNCSCHISPPCNDCVDFSYTRELIENARATIAKHDPKQPQGATP